MQRVTRIAQRLAAPAMQARTYVPGKVIRPEHVLNRAKVSYARPGFIPHVSAVFMYSMNHIFAWYWGAFFLVFWLRGGFSGEIPPPLDG